MQRLLLLSITLFHFYQDLSSQIIISDSIVRFEAYMHEVETVHKNVYLEDGTPILLYSHLGNSIVRKEFYDSGARKLVAGIRQHMGVDWTTVFDYESRTERRVEIKCLIDIADGEFTSYYDDGLSGKLKSKGIVDNTIKVGEWIYFDEEGLSRKVQYSDP